MNFDFLKGTKILEEIESPINSKLTVVRDLAWGVHITSQGLTQSGGIVYEVWRSTLRKVHSLPALPSGRSFVVRRCLILGLGGGSAAKLVRKFWPKAKITGVEIDQIMIDMGKKYLELEELNVKIIVADAFKFLKIPVRPHVPIRDRYDLVLVDLYVGDQVPRNFETYKFLRSLRDSLTESGLAVFNRLYFGEKRTEAVKFGEKLEKIFPKVEIFYPQANTMLICYFRL